MLKNLWDGILTVAILGLLMLLAARLDSTETQSIEGRVVVNDGDSLTLGTERIRLLGIDAPELDQMCRKDNADYPCGRRSREALAALIKGREVTCSGSERDRYNRLLAVCSVGASELNRDQVVAGWAVAYGGYSTEEIEARKSGVGVWAGSFDRPQRWRERLGSVIETEHAMPGLFKWLRGILRLS